MALRRPTAAMAAAIVLFACGVAVAHNTSYKTEIVQDGSGGSITAVVLSGHLESPKSRCLPGRTVKLIFRYPSGKTKLIDTDRTSARGYWAVGGDATGANGAIARVPKKNIGRPGHRHVCRADTASVGA